MAVLYDNRISSIWNLLKKEIYLAMKLWNYEILELKKLWFLLHFTHKVRSHMETLQICLIQTGRKWAHLNSQAQPPLPALYWNSCLPIPSRWSWEYQEGISLRLPKLASLAILWHPCLSLLLLQTFMGKAFYTAN